VGVRQGLGPELRGVKTSSFIFKLYKETASDERASIRIWSMHLRMVIGSRLTSLLNELQNRVTSQSCVRWTLRGEGILCLVCVSVDSVLYTYHWLPFLLGIWNTSHIKPLGHEGVFFSFHHHSPKATNAHPAQRTLSL
jgi:hypothetical protein